MKRRLLLICMAAVLVMAMALTGCGDSETAEACEWPDNELGKLLPETTASATDLSYDDESIYANLKMSEDEYKDYVKACKDAGFTEEQSYSEYDDSCYFDAKNKDGYSLSISYDSSTKIADLSLYVPDDEEEKEAAEEPEEKKQESNSEQKQKQKSEKSDSGSSVSADFKKTMDEYEAFMNDYVDFMKKYENSDDVSGMLEDYSSMIDKYSKFEEKIDAIDEDELSSADYAYYTKVTGRVTEKLSELY